LAALPPGTFPGVDDTDVFTFLERHAPTDTERPGSPDDFDLPRFTPRS
jgi:hypothetical protein